MNSTDNNSTSLYFVEAQWLVVVRLAFEVFLALIGVAGNILVCLVITLQSKMHTVANYFIRNLAIADLGILLVSFPLAVLKEQNEWPFGKAFCRYVYPLNDIFFGVSIWSITLIAIDRYRAIVRGLLPKRGSAAFNTARWMVAGVWLLSFMIISLPLFFVMVFNDHRPKSDAVDCSPNWPNSEGRDLMRQIYIIGLIIFWYILPMTIIIGTYQSISRKLRASTKFNRSILRNFGHPEGSGTRRLRERQNNRAKKILTPVVIVFAITMLPINVLRVCFLYWKKFMWHKFMWVFYNVCVIFVIANSSANFIIYSLVSDEFKQSYKRFFSTSRVRLSSTTEKTLRSPLTRSPLTLSPSTGKAERESKIKNNMKETQM